MSFTYDVTTNVGLVRLLISDTDVNNLIFQDEEISAFLALPNNTDDPLRAAAQALDSIATNEAMVMKMIHLLDLHTNGPAVSAELRNHAAQLRQDALDGEAAEGGLFDYAEMPVNMFTMRERMLKQMLRSLH